MEPNFENGDYLIIDEISYRFSEPQRGEVIVFKYPYNLTQRYIKRVIGLPGETVEIKDDKITIIDKDGTKILDESNYLSGSVQTWGNVTFTLGTEEYFVLGDNRSVSSDSRSWGVLPKQDIIGKVIFRAWPFDTFDVIRVPAY
jgi:signal peptidase I